MTACDAVTLLAVLGAGAHHYVNDDDHLADAVLALRAATAAA